MGGPQPRPAPVLPGKSVSRGRKLLGLLPRCAFRAVRLPCQEHFKRRDALPGMVTSIQTFGSALHFHPPLAQDRCTRS